MISLPLDEPCCCGFDWSILSLKKEIIIHVSKNKVLTIQKMYGIARRNYCFNFTVVYQPAPGK